MLFGEQLKKQSKTVVTDYFRYIKQPLPADILTWESGSREDWVGRESWHTDAINSEGFMQFPVSTDLDGLPQRVLKIRLTEICFIIKRCPNIYPVTTRICELSK